MNEAAALEAPKNDGAAAVDHDKKIQGGRVPIKNELLEVRLSDLLQDNNLRDVTVDDKLKELSASIKEQGVLEPVLVAAPNGGKGYRLLDGYRRCKAAKLAGLLVVPAVVRLDSATGFSQNQVRELQLVANLQREDLSPLEEAKAFRGILDSGSGITQAELGKRIGKSQPYVANRLRLLELPEGGQKLVAEGKVSTHVVAEILKLPPEASTERNRLVRQIEEQIKANGEVSPREFRWNVNAAQRAYRDRRARASAVEKAKFPNCPSPKCGKKGRPPRNEYYGEGFRCSNGHEWDPKSGKLAAKERTSWSVYRPPPPPTLPQVDPKVLTSLTVEQIGKSLFGAARTFREVGLSWDGNKGVSARLVLHVDLPGAKGARIPEFEFREGHKFLWLSGANYQPDDAHRRAASRDRADLEAWLSTFGKGGAKPAAPPAAKKPGDEAA